MLFSDALPKKISGHFHLEILRDGQVIEVVDEPNLVVDGSKYVMTHLVGGAVTNNPVSVFGMGTSGAVANVSNTALTGAFTKGMDSVTYPADNQVTFGFSVSGSEANGLAVMEFGLLTAAGRLFARKVRGTPLNKEADLSFTGTWVLTF